MTVDSVEVSMHRKALSTITVRRIINNDNPSAPKTMRIDIHSQWVIKGPMVLLLVLIMVACSNQSDSPSNLVVFEDVTDQTGVSYQHINGAHGKYYMVEMMGPGVALFDYDRDDDMDMFLTQGHPLDPEQPKADSRYRHRLYRNDSQTNDNGDSQLRFVDVTLESKLDIIAYGMGAATGDFDNDGWMDLFIANLGANQLWRNKGDGTFENVSQRLNTPSAVWSSSAAVVDFDQDGWLDIYVANYVKFSVVRHKTCISEVGTEDYCGPVSYPNEYDQLLRNTGNGYFEDVTAQSGLSKAGPGLGVVTSDFNLDGLPDLYVTNDLEHNYFWINQGDGTFMEEGLLRGNAVNMHGQPEASMGVDAADIDNDGDADLFMTHLLNESNTLYLNNGQGHFRDHTSASGLASASIGLTGFGTNFIDFNNDGWLDLVTINGEVRVIRSQLDQGDSNPLRQPNQLYQNNQGQYQDISHREPAMQVLAVSRGSAVGDLDNDGDTDLIITNNNEAIQILQNLQGQHQQWLGVSLLAASGGPSIGAKAILQIPGRQLWRETGTDASYLSANDHRILFGLGDYSGTAKLEVTWPDGSSQSWNNLQTGQYHTLIQEKQ